MKRPIVGYLQDDEGHWAATLSCGHSQHMRHNPPLSSRPWVQTEKGRQSMQGTSVECPLCDRRELPSRATRYSQTPSYTEVTVPSALLEAHSTKPGVWGVIRVASGQLDYYPWPPDETCEALAAGVVGIICPEVPHRVAPRGEVEFCVEFWRCPQQ